MSRWLALPFAAGMSLATACVTINVYFPAAAAEKAADRIIDDVWGLPKDESAPPASPSSQLSVGGVLLAVLDFVVAPAAAQAPDLDASSPEIARIKSQMENRFGELKPLMDSGAVGLTADGYLAPRDANLIPLAQRNTVRTLVGNENADRAALYREIAVANGQPQWETQIREVFAQRWIVKAPKGWWYQDANGAWKQK